MGFEKFVSKAPSGNPEVSVTRLGVLSFNKAARETVYLKAANYVTLYFDKETGRVGIDPTVKNEGGFRLSKSSGGMNCRAVNFFKEINWPTRELRRYPLTKDEDAGFLVFTLTK